MILPVVVERFCSNRNRAWRPPRRRARARMNTQGRTCGTRRPCGARRTGSDGSPTRWEPAPMRAPLAFLPATLALATWALATLALKTWPLLAAPARAEVPCDALRGERNAVYAEAGCCLPHAARAPRLRQGRRPLRRHRRRAAPGAKPRQGRRDPAPGARRRLPALRGPPLFPPPTDLGLARDPHPVCPSRAGPTGVRDRVAREAGRERERRIRRGRSPLPTLA